MQKLKYITWETEDGVPSFVIFSAHLQHCDMAPRDTWGRRKPLTGAGFVMLVSSTKGQQFTPSGRSDSLDLGVADSDFDTLNQ